MLTIEPAEAVIHGVRLHVAYRATVTLRNNSRNALELTIRAGSPERWAVAPATIFLEAGRTMRVDLRLKLAREIRPKRQSGGSETDGGALRQRDVFHVKTEYFEQRFHASFVMATAEEVAAAVLPDLSLMSAEEHASVLKIQSAARGKAARKRVAAMRG
mmetsp:Transcript_4664/g.11779  ORF Transcript_4664/g.11779 Transcript_4664/m.11779 type:complete len:159 (-) Transcript_4664:327-803(-)